MGESAAASPSPDCGTPLRTGWLLPRAAPPAARAAPQSRGTAPTPPAPPASPHLASSPQEVAGEAQDDLRVQAERPHLQQAGNLAGRAAGRLGRSGQRHGGAKRGEQPRAPPATAAPPARSLAARPPSPGPPRPAPPSPTLAPRRAPPSSGPARPRRQRPLRPGGEPDISHADWRWGGDGPARHGAEDEDQNRVAVCTHLPRAPPDVGAYCRVSGRERAARLL